MATDEQREAVARSLLSYARSQGHIAGMNDGHWNDYIGYADAAIAAYEAHMPTDQFREVTEMVGDDAMRSARNAMLAFIENIQDIANTAISPSTLTRVCVPEEVADFWLKHILQAIGYAELKAENESLREGIQAHDTPQHLWSKRRYKAEAARQQAEINYKEKTND